MNELQTEKPEHFQKEYQFSRAMAAKFKEVYGKIFLSKMG